MRVKSSGMAPGWQMPVPRTVQNLQMPDSRDLQGGQMPRSSPKGERGGGGAVAQLELTDTLPNNVLVCFLKFKHLTGFIYSTASFLKSGVCKYCIA